METACRFGSKPDVYSSPIAEDVQVEVRMEGDGPRMGGDAQLKIVVKNTSSHPRRTTLHSQVAVMYYTGVLKDTVKKDTLNVELMPREGEFHVTSGALEKYVLYNMNVCSMNDYICHFVVIM